MERITSLWTKKSHEGPHSCSHCIKWRLVFSHPRDYQVLYCYRDWKDVLKKARTCQLLAILLEEFKRDERTREKMTDPKADPEEDFFIEGSFRQDVGYAGPSRGHNCYNYWGLALSLKKSWAKTNEKSAVFHLSVHDNNPIATTVLSRPFSGDNAASNATFSKIQNWMTECSKSHVHCQRRPENRSTQSLKARWLDLAHSKVSGLVALDSAEHLSTPPKYAALSYVWGRSQSLSIHQTTTANLQNHAHGLVLASMPKTVQDAILVCAKLELQYLWIDRYCIVQDDPKDVTEQLSIMPQIYANAEITISAAVAEDMDAGFLQDYDQLSNRDLYTLPVDRSKSSSHQSNICLRPTIASRPNDPADTRAWCLQESLLSARLLIYGTTQLRWACREMQAIDGGPEYIAYHPAVPMNEKPPRYVADIYPVLKSADWSWARIVTEYSCRKLTYPSDKLNALAAVAEKFHTRGSTDGMAPIYLAGLWHKVDDPSTLADLLMWTAVSNGSTEEIGIASFMAPSWSWASYVGGWIKYDISHSPNLERSFKVEEAACTPLDNHLPFGTTKSGFIKCFGLVQKSQLQHNGDHWILHSSSSPSLDLLPRFDRTYALTKMLRMYESVFCLVLIRGHAWRGNMAGLLLVTNEDGTFRRVGIWVVNWKTLEKDITKAWLNAFDEQTLVLV